VKVAGTLELSGRHLSVDAPFQDGEENSLLDVLPSHDTPSTDSKLIEESLAKEIERTLSTLPEKESSVIRAFYGIGTKPMSLEEIGQTIGISRERTRQIKEKAIKHLRQKSKNKLLKTYLG
jgi:RNA polymerase primary sigma factor